ncbi:uncharacterized protein MKK02DRAFT_31589 [Dioszegia hungarica]|uniref:Glutaredoxin domain-containing protein n=1 Tax=Dioszegia hungarica TaxID=4972 RepID=A0AA38HAY0_9TREE|nr:uncharacterized protein MKK02DRAFT_31589 [Dioszegia hungarica]KAI9638087.1 hypothetical protein MKK02DRAFT_31589 [Dioszegia hungarica]
MIDYTPALSQPIPLPSSSTQRTVPLLTVQLPPSPPATPPGYGFKSDAFYDMSHHASSSSSTHQRHLPISPLDDSPLSLPTLLSDDEDLSPGGSTGLQTPPSIHIVEPSLTHIITEHAMLNAFAQETTPSVKQDGFERRATYPLLSPQRPLVKKQMWPHIERPASPPTTPKGHPLSKGQTYFNFQSIVPISKPKAGPGHTSTLSYLLRVPRRSRPLVLVVFCVVVFALVALTNGSPRAPAGASTRVQATAFAKMDAPIVPHATVRPTDLPSIAFESAEEELAALISFITSTSANSLPSLDPTKPLEPGAVLDFDPTHPNAREDLNLLKDEIHTLYPLILFGKMRDPWHREVKKMLAEYKIVPAPLIIELDQRRDNEMLSPLLARLLGTKELPLLTLFGKSLGSYHDVLDLREKGELKAVLEEGGMSVKAAKKNKKTKKEREREENERILGPRPIVDGI